MPFVPSVLQTRRRRGSRNATVNSQPFTSFPLPTTASSLFSRNRKTACT
jgi:hypothetical protein